MAPNATSARLFADPKLTDAVTIARESIEVGLSEAGIPVVRFALARGKGTGQQEVAVSEFPAFLDALGDYAENGVNEQAGKVLSPVDMLHATIGMTEEGEVAFRVGGGKGSKPTRLAPTSLPGVVKFFRDNMGRIESAAASIVIPVKK